MYPGWPVVISPGWRKPHNDHTPPTIHPRRCHTRRTHPCTGSDIGVTAARSSHISTAASYRRESSSARSRTKSDIHPNCRCISVSSSSSSRRASPQRFGHQARLRARARRLSRWSRTSASRTIPRPYNAPEGQRICDQSNSEIGIASNPDEARRAHARFRAPCAPVRPRPSSATMLRDEFSGRHERQGSSSFALRACA